MKEVVLSILTFNVCYFLQKQYIFDGKVIVMWTRFCNAQGNFSICCSSFTLNAFYLALVIPTVVHSHIKTKRKLLYSHQFQPQPQTINTLSQTFVLNKYEYYMNRFRLKLSRKTIKSKEKLTALSHQLKKHYKEHFSQMVF